MSTTPPTATDDRETPSFPVVDAIVASAISAAEKRACATDVAHGVLAALRHLRATADEEAGYAMAASIDTAVRQQLLINSLAERQISDVHRAETPLPPAGPGATVAAAILESAADSCLAVNAHAPDNAPLEIAVTAFAGQIGKHLGGIPAWTAVERELHRPHEWRGIAGVLPVGGATVH